MRPSKLSCIVAATFFVALVVVEGPVFAQAERGGFTFLVDLGVGVQHDTAFEETAVGLAGLNFGVGGFLNEDLALLFRLSGTNVSYDFGTLGEVDQVSGVGGGVVQYWLTDRFNVEAGAGLGFWSLDGVDESGLGLILGTGVSIFNRGRHSLQVAVEYAPAFTDSGTVHNLGFTFGYQLF